MGEINPIANKMMHYQSLEKIRALELRIKAMEGVLFTHGMNTEHMRYTSVYKELLETDTDYLFYKNNAKELDEAFNG